MVRGRRWFLVSMLVGTVTSRAGINETASPAERASTTATSATSTAQPATATLPSEVAHLGGRFALTAAQQLSTGPQTAKIPITVDQVIDPAASVPLAATPGGREVELRITIGKRVTAPSPGRPR